VGLGNKQANFLTGDRFPESQCTIIFLVSLVLTRSHLKDVDIEKRLLVPIVNGEINGGQPCRGRHEPPRSSDTAFRRWWYRWPGKSYSARQEHPPSDYYTVTYPTTVQWYCHTSTLILKFDIASVQHLTRVIGGQTGQTTIKTQE
jgi:hypothetical protein